jgi:hypothetical protein
MRVRSLRSVSFDGFDLTSALCQAAANALIEGAAITSLDFTEYSFRAGECAVSFRAGECAVMSCVY